jgi:hypothetical protein
MNSTRFQFTLASLIAAVAAVACGCVVLRFANDLLAGLTFSVVLVALLVGALAAVYRIGAARAFWLGFVLFGLCYLVQAFGFLESGWRLPTTRFLLYVQPKLHDMNLARGWDATTRPSQLVQNFVDVGHCLLAVVFAFVGGLIGRMLHRGSMRKNTEPDAD